MFGKRIAYKRVSSIDQNPERQLEGFLFDRLFIDYASGKNAERPQLQEMLRYIRDEDEIYVHSMDRLARNVSDLKKIVDTVTSKKAKIFFKKENLQFTEEDSPMSNFLLHIMGALSEFERCLILERQREGIAIAKAKGVYKGRSPVLNKEQIDRLKNHANQGIPKARLARNFKISRESVYKYLKS